MLLGLSAFALFTSSACLTHDGSNVDSLSAGDDRGGFQQRPSFAFTLKFCLFISPAVGSHFEALGTFTCLHPDRSNCDADEV